MAVTYSRYIATTQFMNTTQNQNRLSKSLFSATCFEPRKTQATSEALQTSDSVGEGRSCLLHCEVQNGRTAVARQPDKDRFWWALILLLPMWLAGLFLRDYWTPDEPREADIIWRMTWQQDKSVPQLAAEPFMEKPPLSYWLGAASQQVFGTSAAATRVPNLLYALIACLAVGLLGRSMAGARVGTWSMLIFGTLFEVYRVQTWLAPDASLLAGCAVSLLGAYRGFVADRPRAKLGWYTLMHVGALAGFMAKSAPGWIVPALALAVMIVMERRWRELWQWTLWVGVLLQAGVIGVWLWSVSLRPDGMAILKVMFWNNLAGRFTDVHATGALDYASGHRNVPGKYVKESLYYLLPWTACVVAALLTLRRHLHGQAGRPWRFAIAASLPFLLLLSLATTARDVYFAPVCIGISLLVALWCDQSQQSLASTVAMRLTYVSNLLLALLAAILMILLARALPDQRRWFNAGAAVLLVAGVASVHGWRRGQWHPVWHNSALFAITFVSAAVWASPLFNRMQNLHGLALQIHRDTAHCQLALLNPDETTLAMLDYGNGRSISTVAMDTQQAHGAVQSWLSEQPRRCLLVLLPGHAAGPLSSLIKPKPEDLDDGMAGQLQAAGVARITARYALPNGRRYAVLGAVTVTAPVP